MSTNCIICSELFDENNPVCSAKCGHVYHTNCVTTWVNQSNSCPCCRVRLTLKDIKQIYLNFQSRSDNSFLNSSEQQNEVSNLKSQLLSKEADLITCRKEKNDTVVFAQGIEKRASELQRTVYRLESDNSELYFRLESMTALESKVSELEGINKTLSSDLEYFKNIQSIVSDTLKDAEHKINFYEEAMAISNDKEEKHLKTGTSSRSSMHRTPVTSGVSTDKTIRIRIASEVNLPVKETCLKETPPGASNITNKSMKGPSIRLPEDEKANDEISSTSPTSLSRDKPEPRRSGRIMARRNEACEETAVSRSRSGNRKKLKKNI